MKEKTRTHHKYSTIKLKKILHLTTAIAFFLQQLVPYSSAFAMEAPEEERDFSVLRTLPTFSPQPAQSLPLPVELSSVQHPLPSRLEKVRQSLQQTVLESTEALPDRFSSLIKDIKKAFAEASGDVRSKVERKLPNLVKDSYSLYPWAFMRDEDDLGKILVLTSDHAGFRRIKEVMGIIDNLLREPFLPPTFFPNLQQLQSEYKGYVETLCALPLDKRSSLLSPVCLWGDLFEGRSYLVSKSLAYKLLSMSKHGIPEKKNATGSSIVTHVGHIYAKQNFLKERENKPPEGSLNPGMEWAMGSFHQLLIGDHIGSGLVLSAFLVLSQISVEGSLSSEKEDEKKQLREQARDFSTAAIDKKAIINRLDEDDALKSTQNYSLQITPEVEGEFLQTFLQRALQEPQLFEELDKQQVQSLILSTLLMNPGDAKGDNLMVTKPNAQGKRHIISIDNDLSLASMIIKEGENFHTLETRNILLSIPNLMDQEINKEVREHFQSLNVPAFLLIWLKSLESHNGEYTGLQRFMDPKTFSLLQFPLRLRKGTGESLVKRFQDLQYHLRLNPHTPVTLQSIYEQLDPLSALYAKTLLDQERDPLRAFDVLYRQVCSIEEALDIKTHPNRALKGQRVQGMLDQEHTPKDAYKERVHSIEEIAEEILNSIDFQALTPREILQALEEAVSYFPNILKRTIQRNNSLMTSFFPLVQSSMSLSLVKLFIETVPELLTQVDEQGYSLLHRAIEAYVSENIIIYFLEKGMAPDFPTQSNPPLRPLSPLDIACSTYEPHLSSAFTALIKAGARVVTPQLALQFYKKLMSSRSFLSSSSNKESVSSFETLLSSFLTLLERNQQIAWEFSLFHLLPDPTPDNSHSGCIVKTSTRGERVIPADLREQLFDSQRTIIRRNMHGKRDVGWIKKDIHDLSLRLYMKEYPELPGLEEAVGSFMRRLFGFGAPYTELIRIDSIPFLISQEIQGKTAADVLEETPQFFDSPDFLDAYYTSALILMNILINPEDGIFPNYIVEKLPGKTVHRLIGVDNDHAFVPGIAKEPVSGLFSKPEPIVQVKTILFGLDHMLKAVHPQVRAQFLKVDIGEFLEEWLRDLRQKNALYGNLFTQQERIALLPKKPDDPKSKGTYVGIPFQDNAIKDLYQKMSALQSLLQESPQLTHLELLSKVEPHVGHRYGKGFVPSGKSFKDRTQFVDGVNSHLSMTTSGRLFKSMNIPLKESLMETSTKDIVKAHDYRPNRALEELKEIRKQHGQLVLLNSQKSRGGSSSHGSTLNIAHLKTIKLEEDLEKILDQCSFKDIKETDQRALFELMRGRKFKHLILRDSLTLQDRLFQNIQLEYLLTLNLEGCLALTDEIVPLIAGKALSLGSLNLARITTKMKEIGRERKSRTDRSPFYIFFPSLRYLNISYGGVKTVLLTAPKLEVFKARATKDLQILEIGQQSNTPLEASSSALKKVDLREMQSLSLQAFLQLLQTHSNLNEVQTEGARNLPTIPRIPFQEIKTPLEEENLERFNALYEYATKRNDSEAQFQLGEMYAQGQGVKQNHEKAGRWYRKAAEQRHAQATYRIGEMYEMGQGLLAQNFEEALKWYQNASQIYVKTKDPENLRRFIKIYKRATEENDPEAQHQLGDMYVEGTIVKQDYKKAMEWHKKAIQNYLIEENPEHLRQFVNAYKRATEENDPEAQHQLGEMYIKGKIVKQDYKEAMEWYQKAADQNYAEAQCHLGNMYIKGEGSITRDYGKATEWYRKAADQNHAEAQYQLGNIYIQGKGPIKQDYKEAMEWYQKAAGQNHAEAQYQLGEMYIQGNGLKQNVKLALDYYQNAVQSGHPVGKKVIKLIENKKNREKMDLSSQKLGSVEMRFVVALLSWDTVRVLNLSRNHICAEEARILAEVLRGNTIIQELNLYKNDIGNNGADVLSDAFKSMTNLSSLNLSRNSIGDRGTLSLCEAFMLNTSLRNLELGGNIFLTSSNRGEKGNQALEELKKKNPSLRITN